MFHWSPLSTPPAGEKQYRIQYTAISCTIIETNSNRCDHVFPIRPAAALDSNYADYAVVKTAVSRCSSSWQQLSAAVVTAASALIAAALSEVTVASAIYVEVLQWWHVTAASAEVTATLLWVYMRGQLRQPSMLKYWLHLLYPQGQLRQIVYAEVLQRRQLRHLWLQLLYLLY